MTTVRLRVSHSVGCIGGVMMSSIAMHPSVEGRFPGTRKLFMASCPVNISTKHISLVRRSQVVRQWICIGMKSL